MLVKAGRGKNEVRMVLGKGEGRVKQDEAVRAEVRGGMRVEYMMPLG